MAAEAAGFWSYVRKDDQGEGGRIVELSRDLRAQYRIRTADDLELFVDRESIQWGEQWQQRIIDAIAGTTFFIPVITPSYFQSNACRQELLKFFREAERLGLEQLLMPVYWASVPALESGNPENSEDEAVRAVARYQRQDFRHIRFEERSSAEYRKAVAALAAEIADRAASANKVQDVVSSAGASPEAVSSDDEEQPGILDRIAGGEDAMPRIANIMGDLTGQIEAIGSIVKRSGEDVEAAIAKGKGVKAVLPVTARLAKELEEPSSQVEELGRDYANTLGELDPAIHGLLDLVELQTEPDDEQLEFLEQLKGLVDASAYASNGLTELVETAKEMSTLSRALKAPLGRMRGGLQGVLDGRAIIEDWGRRAIELEARHRPDDGNAEPDLGSSPQ